jgi:hypothetical protein
MRKWGFSPTSFKGGDKNPLFSPSCAVRSGFSGVRSGWQARIDESLEKTAGAVGRRIAAIAGHAMDGSSILSPDPLCTSNRTFAPDQRRVPAAVRGDPPPTVFNRNVLAYNKAGVFQATLKRHHQMRGSICGRRPKHPDYRDSVLLCAC